MKISLFTKEGERAGSSEKVEALKAGHIRGVARILIFNDVGKVFLQKRNKDKQVAPNTWDISVGGHVDEGETFAEAAKREAQEELGIQNLELKEITTFYLEEPSKYGTGKSFDTLYSAVYSEEIRLREEEIQDGEWVDLDTLRKEIKKSPEKFAPGLKRSLEEFFK